MSKTNIFLDKVQFTRDFRYFRRVLELCSILNYCLLYSKQDAIHCVTATAISRPDIRISRLRPWTRCLYCPLPDRNRDLTHRYRGARYRNVMRHCRNCPGRVRVRTAQVWRRRFRHEPRNTILSENNLGKYLRVAQLRKFWSISFFNDMSRGTRQTKSCVREQLRISTNKACSKQFFRKVTKDK